MTVLHTSPADTDRRMYLHVMPSGAKSRSPRPRSAFVDGVQAIQSDAWPCLAALFGIVLQAEFTKGRTPHEPQASSC